MKKRFALVVSIVALAASTAFASTATISNGPGTHAGPKSPSAINLTFEGVCDQCPIGAFYGGQGIFFQSNSLGIIEAASGGSGNFLDEPSPVTIAFFLNGIGDVMNVPGGFNTGFSFFYAGAYYTGAVQVWSGPSASGSLLASLALPINNVSGEACQSAGYFYCNWTPVGVNFSGVAESVNFTGGANHIGFDNVTLGSANASPEPASMLLFGSGLLGLGGVIRRRLGK